MFQLVGLKATAACLLACLLLCRRIAGSQKKKRKKKSCCLPNILGVAVKKYVYSIVGELNSYLLNANSI